MSNREEKTVPAGDNPILYKSIFSQQLSKGEKKKLEIVEAAIELFGQLGVDRTSVDQISKKMKTSRSHIHYHFREMDLLIESAIQLMMALGHEYTFNKLKEGLSGKKQFKKYLEGYYGFFVKNPRFIPLMMYFFYVSSFVPRFSNLQAHIKRESFQRIQELTTQLYVEANMKLPKELTAITTQIQSFILTGLIYSLTAELGPEEGPLDSPKVTKSLIKSEEKVFQDILMLTRIKST